MMHVSGSIVAIGVITLGPADRAGAATDFILSWPFPPFVPEPV
jgi:hypothetical protein